MTSPRVLVIENHWDTRYLCATLLELAGYRVVQVEDGGDAAEMLEHLRPSLILVNPEATRRQGLDVLAAARSIAGIALPVVALAAPVSSGDRHRALAAGFAAFLTKPCNPHELVREVERLIGPGGFAGSPSGAAAAA
ncbi:MAG: response regulator [Gemmatimonadota bacterium]|jgi:CheY-like chemotaxis protein|nr:response regulator [Gemmatimonadota bacterium]